MNLHPLLKKAVPIIKSYGYHCYVIKWSHTQKNEKTIYIHVANEDKSIVGYLQVDSWGASIQRSTRHMPSRDWGGGISIDADWGKTPEEITKKWLDEIFSTATFGVRKRTNPPRKLSVDEYIKVHHHENRFVEL